MRKKKDVKKCIIWVFTTEKLFYACLIWIEACMEVNQVRDCRTASRILCVYVRSLRNLYKIGEDKRIFLHKFVGIFNIFMDFICFTTKNYDMCECPFLEFYCLKTMICGVTSHDLWLFSGRMSIWWLELNLRVRKSSSTSKRSFNWAKWPYYILQKARFPKC